MSTTIDTLRAALADRYTIDRELGAGGMATGYLAEDLKHHRKVAIKVLRPDLAATLGPDRFIREIEIADALAYAHSRGVVHRDIKPENVMLSGRHALVMDFGVAKAVNEASTGGIVALPAFS